MKKSFIWEIIIFFICLIIYTELYIVSFYQAFYSVYNNVPIIEHIQLERFTFDNDKNTDIMKE